MYAQPIADVLSAVITVFMAIPLHRELNEMQRHIATISTDKN
jgi:putative effector of murein hydrolase